MQKTEQLKLLIDTLLPGDILLKIPSGVQAGLINFLFDMGLNEHCNLFLNALEEISKQKYLKDWFTLDASERLLCVEWIRRTNRQLSDEILTKCLQGYYSSLLVLNKINVGSIPPFPGGNHLNEDDWQLLENVFNKGAIYRNV